MKRLICFVAIPFLQTPSYAIDIDAVLKKAEQAKPNQNTTIDSSVYSNASQGSSMMRRALDDDSARDAQNHSEYERTHPTCHKKSDCFQISQQASRHTWDIKCTKGPRTGESTQVCTRNDGKWAYGCGITSTFAYHYSSLFEAASKACDL